MGTREGVGGAVWREGTKEGDQEGYMEGDQVGCVEGGE